jgi:hypothetical protein
MTDTPGTYPFAFSSLGRTLLRLLRVGPDSCEVRVELDTLDVRFGRWRLVTPLANVRTVDVTGPYQTWKVLGPRLSLADHGLTFGTNSTAGVCILFHQPVPGLEPTGRLRHPGLTVTVADPSLLAQRLHRHLAGPQDGLD